MQMCSREGCSREAKVRGFCKSHYVRQWKKESISIEKREGNELYAVWCSKRKDRVLEWDDFERFKADVGEPPTPDSKLWRVDRSKPYGPGNVEWRGTFVPKRKDEPLKDYVTRAQYVHKLRLKYGLTLEQYSAMCKAQNDSCPICKRHVDDFAKTKLVVDHNHTTGKVRALLCSSCNSAIGLLGEDIPRIQAAIEYLKEHSDGVEEANDD
jgi:hypothetical protein